MSDPKVHEPPLPEWIDRTIETKEGHHVPVGRPFAYGGRKGQGRKDVILHGGSVATEEEGDDA